MAITVRSLRRHLSATLGRLIRLAPAADSVRTTYGKAGLSLKDRAVRCCDRAAKQPSPISPTSSTGLKASLPWIWKARSVEHSNPLLNP